ncbi:TonB-dependent receptor [Rhizorhabdus dicambivorans]|uniref:TonB-dependent receptor n=1 Tax=Rhizorhabdus dicambivorans TaxID=1850238 RepID=A0A2A4FR56_9SPHN|nr:TonB-dependent receptor [Rhizorhabdus dicambivorans]ATE67227.1 TonB-dependent receptor [Rhizorhabdus dicambivorans]PCE41235.1 TonB-dependent receptor [Rhizorhabdus dicambivorans]
MRKLSTCLLASVAFCAQPAWAEDAAPPAADAGAGEEIVVFGKGEVRQVQQVDAAEIRILTPGSSVIKAIEKLPSVNIQASDPFGNYEWSTRVTIRSFAQSQIGFNFDGIPLGDMQYGNHNGLHISRIVSPENVASVRVSQGAGAVGTQSTNNLGGTVETFSIDPLDRFGGQANATYGSDRTMRGFVRLNVGSAEGLRGFVSYGYGTTDKYKGDGKQDQHMVNAKAVLPVGEGQIDGWFSYSDRREQDYQDMSLDMLGRLGYRSDNTSPDYALAVRLADIGNNRGETGAPISNAAAGTAYPGNFQTVDDAYYDASGLRKDTVAALGFRSPIADDANVALKSYYHHNKGMGLWGTPYVPSPSGSPISIRTTEYDIDRWGLFGSVDFKLGFNSIVVGGWFEHNNFNQARRFYDLGTRTTPSKSFREYPKNPFFTQWNFDFTTDTLQYYVQDAIELGELKINIGWKGFKVDNEADAIVKDVFPEGKFKTEDWFQPSVGMVYDLGGAEVFAGFTQATRAFPSVNGSIWGTTQAGFDAIKDTIKPETSDTYELGVRYGNSAFNGVLGAYLVNFHDRLLGVASGPDIIGSPSVLQNVGSVRSVGVEAAGDLKLNEVVTLYASYTYTDATYRDDVVDGAGAITRLKGKTVVDAPKHMARGEIGYDDSALFARVSANYMSRRFFNYLNDRSVPGRVIFDASLGYRFGADKQYELQLNASNFTGKKYVGTINSAGTGNSGDRQTLLVGAPQQFFISLKAGF